MSKQARPTVTIECPPLNALRRLRSSIREEVRTDLEAVRQRDPAARSDAEILLLYSGVHAILGYRVAHKLYISGHPLPARTVSQLTRFLTGIEIHPGATIGKGLFIDHGMGVVIGETAEIGDNCTLYQGVTLGGTGKDTGKRHPTLGSSVMVGAGAKILGPIRIHDNARIAAGAVVLQEVPENATAVGVPAQIVRVNGRRVMHYADEVDQTSVSDPTQQKLCMLTGRVAALARRVEELERELAAEKQQTSPEYPNLKLKGKE